MRQRRGVCHVRESTWVGQWPLHAAAAPGRLRRRLEKLWDPLLDQGLAGNQRHDQINSWPTLWEGGGAAKTERVALPLPILLGPFYLSRVFAFENDTHRAVSAVRPANIMKAIVKFWGPFWLGGLSDSGWPTSARFVGYKKKRTGGKAGRPVGWVLEL